MAKKNLVPCKACGAQIAANAKSCPHCGAKNKKPFYKKAGFWILVVIILLAVIGSSGKKDAPSTAQATAVSQPQGAPTAETKSDAPAAQKTEYHVGDSLESGDVRITYMSSGEYTSSNQFMQPADGNHFIYLQLAFENVSEKNDTNVSAYNFECYADGYSAQMKYFGEEELSATLSAGRSTSGFLYFEVPKDAQEIEIEYTENMFLDKKITFLYEGEKDSGYELQTKNTATEGALEVGQTAESKQLKITYLSCYEDQSGNTFIVPKDGFRYVTCEFEFENLANSDQSISVFSFDCYADGVNCDAVFFRDDNISATLSSGRKAKGTATFEVPVSASVVEVEYLSNFWTSNRVVFNAVCP